MRLLVGNSYSQIEGASPEQYAVLRKALSYLPDEAAAFFGGFKGAQRRYLIDKKGYFPTGLISLVFDYLYSQNTTIIDKRIASTSAVDHRLGLGSIVPHSWQIDATTAALNSSRGTLVAPTGTGKSILIALLVKSFRTKTLIVVPNLSLKNQLKATIREYFGPTKDIVVENVDSPSLQKHKDFGLLLVDEGHHVAAATYQKLNKAVWGGIYNRFFLTATPFRNVESEQLLFQAIAGDVIYSLPYAEAVKHKYIVPVEGFFVELPKRPTEAHTWSQVYSQLVVNNEERNAVICDLLMRLDSAGSRVLCLVKEIKHGRILSEVTGVPFVCGEDVDSKQLINDFNAGLVSSLIGTTGVCGEGVDTKPCDVVIIAGLGKAKSAFMQQCGRAVRVFGDKTSAKIILFKDKSHKFCLRHFNSQVKILKEEYGVDAVKLEE